MNARSLAIPPLLAAGMIACAPVELPQPEASFLSPALGQTAVPTGLPLRAASFGHGIPSGYALGQPFTVVDLDARTAVEGTVAIDADAVTFAPRGGWQEGRRYRWTFGAPATLPHGPEHRLPSTLDGVAWFSTGSDLRVLDAVITRPKRLCVVLSRPATEDEVAAIDLSLVDGCCTEPGAPIGVELEHLPAAEWGDVLELDPRDDPGLDVACHAFDSGELEPESTLRIEVGDASWEGAVPTGTLPEVFDSLRRGSCEPLADCPPYPDPAG
jgi:hypothetical protein